MSVILITGTATGIGNLTARALAAAGHTVYASMRDPGGHNAVHARELASTASRDGTDLRVIELDVQSQDSANAAVAAIVSATGQLDVVVHNAGHLYVGYVEAFTAEDIARLLDVNMLGAHRVNRAALPHMRERRSGTLLWVGSTSVVSVPPFLGPYVASKATAAQRDRDLSSLSSCRTTGSCWSVAKSMATRAWAPRGTISSPRAGSAPRSMSKPTTSGFW